MIFFSSAVQYMLNCSDCTFCCHLSEFSSILDFEHRIVVYLWRLVLSLILHAHIARNSLHREEPHVHDFFQDRYSLCHHSYCLYIHRHNLPHDVLSHYGFFQCCNFSQCDDPFLHSYLLNLYIWLKLVSNSDTMVRFLALKSALLLMQTLVFKFFADIYINYFLFVFSLHIQIFLLLFWVFYFLSIHFVNY